MPIRLPQTLKCSLEAGLSFFYPDVCQNCGNERATANEGFIGPSCWKQIRFIRPPFCERCGLPFPGEITSTFECSNCREIALHFCWARSAVAAEGMVLDIVHRYKYNRALWFESFLADLLLREAAPSLRQESWDLIVPVPLHPLKEREREFNQAGRLAQHLARELRLSLDRKALRRVEPTRTQTQLSRTERAANVRRAFALNKPVELKGKRVVLIDDVLTTGATTSACARLLREGGAAEVCVWTVARGLFS